MWKNLSSGILHVLHIAYCILHIPELKNVLSGSPGQEDFLAEQVTFKDFLPSPDIKSCSKTSLPKIS